MCRPSEGCWERNRSRQTGMADLSEPDTDLAAVFEEVVLHEQIFRFEQIIVSENKIQYVFTFGKLNFTSDVHLPLSVSALLLHPSYGMLLFSIGMCILPWYWMGFATKVIEIDERVGRFHPSVIDYWTEVYNNVLLEYLYLNRLDFDIEIRYSSDDISIRPGHISNVSFTDKPKVLVPIGGINNNYYLV